MNQYSSSAIGSQPPHPKAIGDMAARLTMLGSVADTVAKVAGKNDMAQDLFSLEPERIDLLVARLNAMDGVEFQRLETCCCALQDMMQDGLSVLQKSRQQGARVNSAASALYEEVQLGKKKISVMLGSCLAVGPEN